MLCERPTVAQPVFGFQANHPRKLFLFIGDNNLRQRQRMCSDEEIVGADWLTFSFQATRIDA
jgi:hypothetical protein